MRLPLVAAGAAILGLSGCGPIVQVGGPREVPPVLYTIRSDAPLPAPSPVKRVVVVNQPAVVGKLQTLRVPVTVADTRIAYLKDAQWVENPSRLVQRLLVDRMNAAGLTAIGPGVRDGGAHVLSTTVREFSLDVRERAAPRSVVRLDVVLTDPKGALIGARQFEAAVSIANDRPESVVEGLNRASNMVATDLVRWVRES